MSCFWIFGETLGVDGVVAGGAVAVEGASVPGRGCAAVAGEVVAGGVVGGVVVDGVVVDGAVAVEGAGAPFDRGAACLVAGVGDVPGVAVGAGNGWPGAPGNGLPSGAFG